MGKCTLYDLGCPNQAISGEIFCEYHQKEMEYEGEIGKVSSKWTEEDRNNFHNKYGFERKPM